MPVLNLRNVPESLMRELRAAAAMAGKPFHEFCVGLLEAQLIQRTPIKRAPSVTVHPPIETMTPATRAAVTDLAKAAAVSFGAEIDSARARQQLLGDLDAGVDLAIPEQEIEIT